MHCARLHLAATLAAKHGIITHVGRKGPSEAAPEGTAQPKHKAVEACLGRKGGDKRFNSLLLSLVSFHHEARASALEQGSENLILTPVHVDCRPCPNSTALWLLGPSGYSAVQKRKPAQFPGRAPLARRAARASDHGRIAGASLPALAVLHRVMNWIYPALEHLKC